MKLVPKEPFVTLFIWTTLYVTLDILPARPIEVEAASVSDKSMTIQWTLPANAIANPEKFQLNVTKTR